MEDWKIRKSFQGPISNRISPEKLMARTCKITQSFLGFSNNPTTVSGEFSDFQSVAFLQARYKALYMFVGFARSTKAHKNLTINSFAMRRKQTQAPHQIEKWFASWDPNPRYSAKALWDAV